MSNDRIQEIRRRLTEAFSPEKLEIVDEGHLHVGHEGAKSGRGHFRVTIVSQRFAGLRRLQTHRLVYDALGSLMQSDIHALTVEASAPTPE